MTDFLSEAQSLFEYTRGGFLNYSITPEILFTESRTDVDLLYITNQMAIIQTIDIPLTFKLGLQLSRIFRPYVLANIYGSYMVKYYGECNQEGIEYIDKLHNKVIVIKMVMASVTGKARKQ